MIPPIGIAAGRDHFGATLTGSAYGQADHPSSRISETKFCPSAVTTGENERMTGSDDPERVDIPRAQSGSSPQHLLATLLGEYVGSDTAAMPSAAIGAMLNEFGISASSSRTALSRVTHRGLLEATKQGRQTAYRLTPIALARHHTRMRHFLAFGSTPPAWTGDWVVVAFSLPEAKQAKRHGVRKTLGQLGFVRLYDSVWIKPGNNPEEATKALEEILADLGGEAKFSAMQARFDDEKGPHGPASAYDLTGLIDRYNTFITDFTPLAVRVRAGDVGSAEALVARTNVMDAWRIFPDTDPDLPDHLLPAHWPRKAARDLFIEVHDVLGPLAEERLVQITTPYSAEAASLITHFDSRSFDHKAASPATADHQG